LEEEASEEYVWLSFLRRSLRRVRSNANMASSLPVQGKFEALLTAYVHANLFYNFVCKAMLLTKKYSKLKTCLPQSSKIVEFSSAENFNGGGT
jgi:hypothetical protein